MPKLFTRNIENFICENCGANVSGNGYTNHCPKCLFSKHIDNNPGDRENSCQGLMQPMLVAQEKGEYVITHQCLKCGLKKRNKAAENDNFDELLKIASLYNN